MPLLIRRALVTQAAELSALALSAKAFWGYSDEFIKQCTPELTYSAEQLRAKDWFFACAYEVGALTAGPRGFYALTWCSQTAIELEALFVAPSYIGKGVGTTLFAHATQQAASLGAAQLLMQSDPHAAAFYLARGATHIGQRASQSIAQRSLPLFSVALI